MGIFDHVCNKVFPLDSNPGLSYPYGYLTWRPPPPFQMLQNVTFEHYIMSHLNVTKAHVPI